MEETFLTPQEAAELLKVKKTTVYEMIRSNRLKAVKIGKQFRIRKEDVEELLGGVAAAEPGKSDARPAGGLLLCGQDLLLDNLCAHVNAHAGAQMVARSYLGSYNGIFALYQEQADLATAHLWDAESDSYNLPFVEKMLPGMSVQLYHIVNRPIGIYTAPGNPKQICGIRDFARGDVRMVNREKGSGIRVLTDSLFLQENIDPAAVMGYDNVARSHAAAADTIAAGEADCAYGNARAVHLSKKVDFLPVKYEQYDLIVPIQKREHPVVKQILAVLASDSFRAEIDALGGYDTTNMGQRLL